MGEGGKEEGGKGGKRKENEEKTCTHTHTCLSGLL